MWKKAVVLLFLTCRKFDSTSAQEGHGLMVPKTAEFQFKDSGLCSPTFLKEKGLNVDIYQPSIVFDSAKVRLEPKAPSVPGCFRLIAENVQVLKPMRDLVGEFEIRIGGNADPKKKPLPCGKANGIIDRKAHCGGICNTNDACIFCNFCEKLRRRRDDIRQRNFTRTPLKRQLLWRRNGHDDCDCEPILPGSYDIDTEVCTPPLKDIADKITPLLRDEIAENGGKVSIFITVYVYNMPRRRYSGILSELGRKILFHRRLEHTAACFIIATDSQLHSAAGGRQTIAGFDGWDSWQPELST